MAIQYLCDVCGQPGKEGAASSMTGAPFGWARISVLRPQTETVKQPIVAVPQPIMFIGCSQNCAEKALDIAREAHVWRLRRCRIASGGTEFDPLPCKGGPGHPLEGYSLGRQGG